MLHLDYRDVRPLYAQLTDKIRQQISGGVLVQGDKLPSVRELAVELSINPNTIQRAYRELEAEGYIFSIAGKGSFAADTSRLQTPEQQQAVERLLADARALYRLGFDRARILALIEETPLEEKE